MNAKKLLLLALPIYCFPAHASEVQKAMKAFDQCYLQQLEVFKTSCEPADQLAIAVVNGCPNEMADFRSAAIRTFGPDKANQLGTQLSQKRQEQAIASLMRARLEHPCPR